MSRLSSTGKSIKTTQSQLSTQQQANKELTEMNVKLKEASKKETEAQTTNDRSRPEVENAHGQQNYSICDQNEWIAECGLVSVHENLYDEDYYKQHPIPSTYQHGEKKSTMYSAHQDFSNA
jgi:hypothetical protein